MKNLKFSLTLILALGMFISPLLLVSAQTQDPQIQNQATALMRGYRTGYSDGYQSGVIDVANNSNRDFRGKTDYEHADRAYNSNYGPLEEYRDGYQQGFEVGYNAGFDRKPFDSSIPPDLKRKTDDATVQYPVDQNKSVGNPSQVPVAGVIPRDTVMRIELLTNLSTDASQKGDRFQARVLEPKAYDGATLEGHIAQVKRPGKAKSNAQLQLAFDQIRLVDGRSSKLSGQVIEVIPNSGSQGVGKVDPEGGVQGQSSTRGDIQKVGGAAGIGAVIGAITGGGIGAAVGATIGAGVGTAGVLSQRGKDIRLYQGQQLRIRTAGDAEIQ